MKKSAAAKTVSAPGTKKGVVIMMGVAKKKTEASTKRGELIEQNQVNICLSFKYSWYSLTTLQ